MTNWESWRSSVEAAGGFVTAWPVHDPAASLSRYAGQWCAKYKAATYAAGLSSGAIGSSTPTTTVQDSSGGTWVYVLAPQAAQADGPATMSPFQRAQNAAFSLGDQVADKLGLPPLASWERWAKIAAIGAAVLLVLGLLTWAGMLRKELAA